MTGLRLTDFLRFSLPGFDARATKLHFAQWNGRENPLDVFYDGQFDLWQQAQTRRNFPRDLVLGLIQMPRPDRWLFAGLWRREGEPAQGPDRYNLAHGLPAPEVFFYSLEPVPEIAPLIGRLHIGYTKTARSNYRNLETLEDDLLVASLSEAPRRFPRFTSYRDTRLSFRNLTTLGATAPEDWRTALTAVAGVYLITGADGAQYVGSAGGAGGIWTRWMDYARTGHGGNALLRAYLGRHPLDTARGLHFTILETADLGTAPDMLIARESWWKETLGTRAHGLNLN
jgi:hypothetical protein